MSDVMDKLEKQAGICRECQIVRGYRPILDYVKLCPRHAAMSVVAPPLPADARELVEQLAALAHEQWSGWMNYLFEKCSYKGHRLEGYVLVLPTEYGERWVRQAATAYVDLPEGEKDSDRVEARKVLSTISQAAAIADDCITELRGRSDKARMAKERFQFYEPPRWEDVDQLLSAITTYTTAHGEERWREGAEAAAKVADFYANGTESNADVPVENWSDFARGQVYAAQQLAMHIRHRALLPQREEQGGGVKES